MQFLNFFFLFNCQVEFSNLYKNYFQKRHLLQAQTVFSTNCCKSLSKGFWIEKDIVSFYFFDSFTVAYPGLSLGIPFHETKVTRKLGTWEPGLQDQDPWEKVSCLHSEGLYTPECSLG